MINDVLSMILQPYNLIKIIYQFTQFRYTILWNMGIIVSLFIILVSNIDFIQTVKMSFFFSSSISISCPIILNLTFSQTQGAVNIIITGKLQNATTPFLLLTHLSHLKLNFTWVLVSRSCNLGLKVAWFSEGTTHPPTTYRNIE